MGASCATAPQLCSTQAVQAAPQRDTAPAVQSRFENRHTVCGRVSPASRRHLGAFASAKVAARSSITL